MKMGGERSGRLDQDIGLRRLGATQSYWMDIGGLREAEGRERKW